MRFDHLNNQNLSLCMATSFASSVGKIHSQKCKKKTEESMLVALEDPKLLENVSSASVSDLS